jgi:NADH-quinone oxidoreductase subunit H
LAGWSSNRSYALYGALRSAAQIISYEVTIGFSIAVVLICTGTINLRELVEVQEGV